MNHFWDLLQFRIGKEQGKYRQYWTESTTEDIKKKALYSKWIKQRSKQIRSVKESSRKERLKKNKRNDPHYKYTQRNITKKK